MLRRQLNFWRESKPDLITAERRFNYCDTLCVEKCCERFAYPTVDITLQQPLDLSVGSAKLFQTSSDFVRASRTLVGLRCKQTEDKVSQPFRQIVSVKGGEPTCLTRSQDLFAASDERRAARDHLKNCRAQRVQVSAFIGAGADYKLGSHIVEYLLVRYVDHMPITEHNCNIEIYEMQRAPLVEQYVAGLQIAVQDTAAVDMR